MEQVEKEEISVDSLNKLWKFFASVRVTVVILLSLAATSVIGTIIPQNESHRDYFHEYGEVLYKIFYAFGIFDMYHSWWFQFLIILLTVNIIVCSIDRLASTWKVLFPPKPVFTLSRFSNLPNKEEFTAERSPEELKEIYEPQIAKAFRYVRTEPAEGGFCIFAEKGRWTRLGVYIVHLSVVFLLLGGLIGSIFGFEGFVNIPENERTDRVRLRKNSEIKTLDFEIQCDDFQVSFYESGAPKEYRSALTILENGNPVLKKDIIVNDPLRYKGINIFQSSYGTLAPKEVTLSFTSTETGMGYIQKTSVGESFDLPEQMGTFVIKDFDSNYHFMGHTIGEAFIGTLTPPDGGEPTDIVMPLRFPNFDRMRKGDFIASVTDYESQYYTGLQVTKDPGVIIVYTGFIVMIIGIFITFFMSHQRLCVEIKRDDEKSTVMVAGIANKNKMAMEIRAKKISQALSERISLPH
jgi:cytochrome c biogenesis protein